MAKVIFFASLVSTFLYGQQPSCLKILGQTVAAYEGTVIVMGDTSRGRPDGVKRDIQEQAIDQFTRGLFSNPSAKPRTVYISGMDARGLSYPVLVQNGKEAELVIYGNSPALRDSGGASNLGKSLVAAVNEVALHPHSAESTIVMVTDGAVSFDSRGLKTALRGLGPNQKINLIFAMVGDVPAGQIPHVGELIEAGIGNVQIVKVSRPMGSGSGLAKIATLFDPRVKGELSQWFDLNRKSGLEMVDFKVSPNGNSFLIIGTKGIEVWETGASGKSAHLLKTIKTQADPDFIAGVRFFSDGNRFAWLDRGRTLNIASTGSGEILAQHEILGHFPALSKIEISPDGHGLVIQDVNGVFTSFELQGNLTLLKGQFRPGGEARVEDFALNGNTNEIVVATKNGELQIIRPNPARIGYETVATLGKDKFARFSVKTSPDGKLAYTLNWNGGLSIYDIPGRRLLSSVELGAKVNGEFFVSPDGKQIHIPIGENRFRTYSGDDLSQYTEFAIPKHGGPKSRISELVIDPATGEVMAIDFANNLWAIRKELNPSGVAGTAKAENSSKSKEPSDAELLEQFRDSSPSPESTPVMSQTEFMNQFFGAEEKVKQ